MSTTDYKRRGAYTDVSDRLVVEACCECGVLFGMPSGMERRARKDPSIWFYCPNGHHQHYPGKTEEVKQRERAERAEANNTHLRDQLEAERRSKIAIKGHLTRARKRGGQGMCPVEGCRRHFANVHRHIQTQHPDFLSSLNS